MAQRGYRRALSCVIVLSMKSQAVIARNFAKKAHGNQKYGLHAPYVAHLDSVVSVLTRYGFTEDEYIVSGYLHDCVEDTPVSILDIQVAFGLEVANIVYAVTNEPGKNRKERHLKTYLKLILNSDAIIVKLCDRIANVEYSVMTDDSKLYMYKKEYVGFKDALYPYSPVSTVVLWNQLELLLEVDSSESDMT